MTIIPSCLCLTKISVLFLSVQFSLDWIYAELRIEIGKILYNEEKSLIFSSKLLCQNGKCDEDCNSILLQSRVTSSVTLIIWVIVSSINTTTTTTTAGAQTNWCQPCQCSGQLLLRAQIILLSRSQSRQLGVAQNLQPGVEIVELNMGISFLVFIAEMHFDSAKIGGFQRCFPPQFWHSSSDTKIQYLGGTSSIIWYILYLQMRRRLWWQYIVFQYQIVAPVFSYEECLTKIVNS